MFPTFLDEVPTPQNARAAMGQYLAWRRERTVDGFESGFIDWRKIMAANENPSTESVFADLDQAALIAHDADAELAHYVFNDVLLPDPKLRPGASQVLHKASALLTSEMDALSAVVMDRCLWASDEQIEAFAKMRAYHDECAAARVSMRKLRVKRRTSHMTRSASGSTPAKVTRVLDG